LKQARDKPPRFRKVLVLSVQPIATPPGGGLLGSFVGFLVRGGFVLRARVASGLVRRRFGADSRPAFAAILAGLGSFREFPLDLVCVCGHFGR
jgi:hypothetical protein